MSFGKLNQNQINKTRKLPNLMRFGSFINDFMDMGFFNYLAFVELNTTLISKWAFARLMV